MARYLLKRVVLAVVTIWAVATITFCLMNMVPGGPFLSEKAISPAATAALEAKYGLDKPFGERYVTYIKDACHGDFGLSLKQRGRTVMSIISAKFPVSAKVGGVAVLVSLLEADNDLYNNGIVDVSYKYPKMYVIRPQFFIPMITLLRNAALNSLQYQKELAVVRNQQLDLYNFEANMQEFKDSFGRNYRIASEKFQTAIDEIDKTIDHLEKVKKALQSSENNLRIANDKADDLTIKKLTKNAPSVKQMFDDLNKEGE